MSRKRAGRPNEKQTRTLGSPVGLLYAKLPIDLAAVRPNRHAPREPHRCPHKISGRPEATPPDNIWTDPMGVATVGEWTDDGFFGLVVWPNGACFAGHLDEEGYPTGRGKMTQPDGGVLYCTFEKGVANGPGVETRPDGTVFHCTWIGGIAHGAGVETQPDGGSFVCFFSDGFAHGLGSFTFADGSRLDGGWVRDELHGACVVHSAAHAAAHATFADGVLLSRRRAAEAGAAAAANYGLAFQVLSVSLDAPSAYYGFSLSAAGVVHAVAAGTLASAAGLRPHDVVEEVDDAAVGGGGVSAVTLWRDSPRPTRRLRVWRAMEAGGVGGGWGRAEEKDTSVVPIYVDVGKAERLGVRLGERSEVCEVEPGSAAAEAGVRPGDVIVAVDGVAVGAEASAAELWFDGEWRAHRVLHVERAERTLLVEVDTSGATTTGFLVDARSRRVLAVLDGSIAAAAGLREGDLLLDVDGVPVTDGAHAIELWEGGKSRWRRTLRVLRDKVEEKAAPPAVEEAAVEEAAVEEEEEEEEEVEEVEVEEVEVELQTPEETKVGFLLAKDAKVVAVLEGSIANRAGLRVGDEVKEVDGVAVSEEVGAAELWGREKARPVRLVAVSRDGHAVNLLFDTPPATKTGFLMDSADRVLAVLDGSIAAAAGLREGDKVVEVDGVPVAEGVSALRLWEEGQVLTRRKLRVRRQKAAEAAAVPLGDGKVRVVLDRSDSPDTSLGFLMDGKNKVLAVRDGSIAAAAGLRAGDEVLQVDCVPVSFRVSATHLIDLGVNLRMRALTVQRARPFSGSSSADSAVPVPLTPGGKLRVLLDRSDSPDASFGFLTDGENAVLSVREGSIAAAAGLREGDVLLEVDGVPVSGGTSASHLIERGLDRLRRVFVVRRGLSRSSSAASEETVRCPPSEEIRVVLDKTGLPCASFGFMMDERNKVLLVREGSIAAAAGLQEGDEVIEVDDVPVTTAVSAPHLFELGKGRDRRVFLVRRGNLAPGGAEAEDAVPLGDGKVRVVLDKSKAPDASFGFLMDERDRVISVREGSIAELAGLREGDEVLQVDGAAVGAPSNALELWDEGIGRPKRVLTVRRGSGGAEAEEAEGGGEAEEAEEAEGRRVRVRLDKSAAPHASFGFVIDEADSVLFVGDGSIAAAAGLQEGDEVLEVDGAAVGPHARAVALWDEGAARPLRVLTVRREAAPPAEDEGEVELRLPAGVPAGFRMDSEGVVLQVKEGSAAEEAGLCVDDVVVAVDGVRVAASGATPHRLWKEGAAEGASVRKLTVRPAAVRTLALTLHVPDGGRAGFRMSDDGVVLGVDPLSVAAEAGMQVGDLVDSIDGVPAWDGAIDLYLAGAKHSARVLTIVRKRAK